MSIGPQHDSSFEWLRDFPAIQRWLADFQCLTGLTVRLLPPGGAVRPRCLPEPAFCREVKRCGACENCPELQTRLVRAAEQSRLPGRVSCGADIVHLAVPVVLSGRTVGILFGGKVRRTSGPVRPIEELVRRLGAPHVSHGKLGRLSAFYDELTVFSRVRLAAATRLLQGLAQEIATNLAQGQSSRPCLESALVSRTREVVRQHENGRLTTESVARALKLNTSYFCRAFRRATGLTFHAYLAKLRVEAAVAALRNTEQSITSAGYAAGFQSSSDFNRVFKAVLGITPTEFRKGRK